MTNNQQITRADDSEMMTALAQAGATFSGKKVRCPFHDDSNPSGSIFRGEDGAVRFKCFGCNFSGDVFDVRAKSEGRPLAEILRESSSISNQVEQALKMKPATKRVHRTVDDLLKSIGSVEAHYPYSNPVTGEVEVVQVRYLKEGRKQFLPFHAVDGGFVMGAPPKPWPLYNRSRLQSAETVIVVEGEKCVHALTELGFVATTSLSGAANAKNADWSSLAGKKVIIWPDFDALNPKTGKRPGFDYANDVAESLSTLEPAVDLHWLDPEIIGLKDDGSDCIDFIEIYGRASRKQAIDAINCAIGMAKPMSVTCPLKIFIEDSIAGRLRTLPFPWPNLTRLASALVPGTVVLLCADPGAGKTLLTFEAATWWQENGIKVALYELEDVRARHLARVLAQVDQQPGLTSTEWMRENPDDARAAYFRHESTVKSFSSSLTTVPPNRLPTHRDLLDWLKKQAEAGCRIVIIDPVTSAAPSEKPWIDDLNFMMAAKQIAEQFNLTLIIVTHPRKGGKGRGSLDDLAGGAAYPRFAQTVLWLHDPKQTKRAQVAGPAGAFSASYNRMLRIMKARNGQGTGVDLAFILDPRSLRFSEQGAIMKALPDGDSSDEHSDLRTV